MKVLESAKGALARNDDSKPARSAMTDMGRKEAFDLLKKAQDLPIFNRISSKEVMFFSTQLSIMLDTGSSLTSSLATLHEQAENPKFKVVLRDLLHSVEGGRMLSAALGKHPNVFSQVFVSMIRAGETGGFMREILQRLVEHQKKQQRMKSTIRAAMMYPLAILGIMAVVVILMVTFVLPKFMVLFEGLGEAMPMPTKILLFTVNTVRYNWYYILPGIIGVSVGLFFFFKSEKGKRMLDTAAIRAPVVGSLMQMVYSSQLFRTMGILLDSGVPMLESLNVVRAIFSNHHYSDLLKEVLDCVKRGGGMATPFTKSDLIQPITSEMVRTGESSGALAFVMTRIADHFDEETEVKVHGLTTIMEPIMIVVMGVLVGFIAMAIILPVFKLSKGMG